MSKGKILFVVHRYVPYEGGSEFYVRDMAEEMLSRGYDVTVLTGQHKGDQNGVHVTDNYQALVQKWDLIVVHGGDVHAQDTVHYNASAINFTSPVCYMIIKPSENNLPMQGLQNHRIIAYSTPADIELIKKHGVLSKARRIRHGIHPYRALGYRTLRNNKKVFVSAGGFYPNKCMKDLATVFDANSDKFPNTELHLYGYGMLENAPTENDVVKVFKGKKQSVVIDAIASADAYILNSSEEGYGLVLLEAMLNGTPWFGREHVGAVDELAPYGHTYKNEKDLIDQLIMFNPLSYEEQEKVDLGQKYVLANHTIKQTGDDIEDIINETR